ncbi:MAG: DUF1232 domain-containing protein [Chloroflexi bacterium]|nr:DUF1232 domain-containing protein [Chloroflexota bacterium]
MRWKEAATQLKQEVNAIYWSARHPRTSWWAKVWILLVVAYAISPIDLIPDFIPVLGYLDDLLLIPIGLYIAIQLIPPDVLVESRKMASEKPASSLPLLGAAIIVFFWIVVILLITVSIA